MKQCPSCNKKYRDYDQYCPKCNYKLKYVEGTEIEDYPPEPHIPANTTPTITCPYCKSTDCKKISHTSKALRTAIFGIYSLARNSKEWHCRTCGSDF